MYVDHVVETFLIIESKCSSAYEYMQNCSIKLYKRVFVTKTMTDDLL